MKDLLPSMEFEFDFKAIGEETKQEFSGKFKYKRLNIKARGDALKYKAYLDEALPIEDDLYMLYDMISWLKFGLTEYPEWWKDNNYGLELYDVNIITELYKIIQDFEDKWKEELLKESK